MYTVKVLDINELDRYREIWNRLALSMNIPSIFCTWEWIYTWLEQYGSAYEPFILSISDADEIKGFFPLAFDKSNDTFKSKTLLYCGSKELYPDHLDIICEESETDRCVLSVFDFLSNGFKEWDVLDVSLLAESSGLLTHLRGKDTDFEADIKQISTAPFITLSGTFDEYTKRFTSKKRYNIRSSQRKLHEQFGMLYTACEQQGIDKGMETLFELHALRADMKNMKSNFNRPDIKRFHCALAKRASDNGWLFFRSLNNDTETIASMYSFVFGGHLFYYQIGFNPKWERYSPGTVLIYEVLKEAFSRGYKEFDFLRGGEEYKSSWTDELRPLFALSLYNNTLKASLTKTISKSKGILKSKIKQIIS